MHVSEMLGNLSGDLVGCAWSGWSLRGMRSAWVQGIPAGTAPACPVRPQVHGFRTPERSRSRQAANLVPDQYRLPKRHPDVSDNQETTEEVSQPNVGLPQVSGVLLNPRN